jgi:hypothetical protein
MQIKRIELISLLAIVFLLGLVFSTTGLQDWWPALLNNWANDNTLYKDIPFYTGPLYPVLLKITLYISSDIFAPIILGSLITILYVLSAFAMFKAYLNKAELCVNYNIKESNLLLTIAFFLVISRFLTIYLIPNDYHTLSLLIYCLIINKLIASDLLTSKQTFFDQLSTLLSRLPMPLLIAALVLNRTHEGLIFFILYFIYKTFALNNRNHFFLYSLKQCSKEIVASLLIVIIFFIFASPIFNIANIWDTFLYLIVEAPKSKSFGTDNYLLKLISNFWNEILVQFSIGQLKLNLSFLIVLLIAYRYADIKEIRFKFAKLSYGASLLCLVFLGVYLNVKGRSNFYQIIVDSTLLVIFIQILLSGYAIFVNNNVKRNFDFTFIPILSLFISHLLSTSGIINEPLLILYLPSLIYNLFIINDRIFSNLVFRAYSTIIFMVAVGYIVSYKINSPRKWWLTSEIPIYGNRQLMFGKLFDNKFPNLAESLSYADTNFLMKSNELCAYLNDHDKSAKILAYPIPFYTFACKSSKQLSTYTMDFTFWYDVGSQKHIESLQNELMSDAQKPKFIVYVSSADSLFSSATYYNSSNRIQDYIHYKFSEFINNLVRKDYSLMDRYYLIEGETVIDPNLIAKLDSFDSISCFRPSIFKSCAQDLTATFKTIDITVVYLYKYSQ